MHSNSQLIDVETQLKKARMGTIEDLIDFIHQGTADVFFDRINNLLKDVFYDRHFIESIVNTSILDLDLLTPGVDINLDEYDEYIKEYNIYVKELRIIDKYFKGDSNDEKTIFLNIDKKIALLLLLSGQVSFMDIAGLQEYEISDSLPLMILNKSYSSDKNSFSIDLFVAKKTNLELLEILVSRYSDSERVQSFAEQHIIEFACACGYVPIGNVEHFFIRYLVVNNDGDTEKVISSILEPLRERTYKNLMQLDKKEDEEVEFGEEVKRIVNRTKERFNQLIEYCRALPPTAIQQEIERQEEVKNKIEQKIKEFKSIVKEVIPYAQEIIPAADQVAQAVKEKDFNNNEKVTELDLPLVMSRFSLLEKVPTLIDICMNRVKNLIGISSLIEIDIEQVKSHLQSRIN